MTPPRRLDHFPVREPGAVSQVERDGVDRVDLLQRQEVRIGDVGDMHVIADAGAVRRVVVVPEDPDFVAEAERYLDQDCDQVGLRDVELAARRRGPAGIEVPQRTVAQPVGPGVPRKHLLERQLRCAVSIDRTERSVLPNRHRGGFAVNRRGRRKDEPHDAGCPHRVEQVEAAHHVHLVEGSRVGHRFAYERFCREVHHGIGTNIRQHLRQAGAVTEITLEKTYAIRDRGSVALRQVVKGDDGFAVREQSLRHHASDVAGGAGDKDGHGMNGRKR